MTFGEYTFAGDACESIKWKELNIYPDSNASDAVSDYDATTRERESPNITCTFQAGNLDTEPPVNREMQLDVYLRKSADAAATECAHDQPYNEKSAPEGPWENSFMGSSYFPDAVDYVDVDFFAWDDNICITVQGKRDEAEVKSMPKSDRERIARKIQDSSVKYAKRMLNELKILAYLHLRPTVVTVFRASTVAMPFTLIAG